MGAATSSNAVTAVTNVTNSVVNSTTANTAQMARTKNDVIWDNCSVILSGNLDVNQAASVTQKSKQIANVDSSTSLTNDISQSILQEATSTVGSMGIGYSNASNTASVFANASNLISNDLSVSANQFSKSDNRFLCSNTTIIAKNLDINQSITTAFLSDQTIKQSNTSNVINDISQSVTQKASAKVEGLASFIIALAVLIGIIGYSATKVISSPAGLIVLFLILCFVIGWMFVRKTPPFFSEPLICNPSNIGRCGQETCGELKERTVKLLYAPLRYILPIVNGGHNDKNGNLLDIAVISLSKNIYGDKPPNGGYTTRVMNGFVGEVAKFENLRIQSGAEPVPNLLYNPAINNKIYKIPEEFTTGGGSGRSNFSLCTPGKLQVAPGFNTKLSDCPSKITPDYLDETNESDGIAKFDGIANLNLDEWKKYVSNDINAKYARFLLLYIINNNLDNSIYIEENEIVGYKGTDGKTKYSLAKNLSNDKKYKFKPVSSLDNFNDGISGGGDVNGLFGICQNNEYKLNKFMKTIGIWIFVVVIILIIILIIIKNYKKQSTDK